MNASYGRPAHHLGRTITAVLVAVVLAACAGGGDPSPAAAPSERPSTAVAASPGGVDPQLLQPLTMLGPCTADPNAIDATPPPEAVFPDKTVITSQDATGPLTTIKGYIPMTPVQVQVFYQGQERYDVLQIENEIQESEALLADGNHRLFVKAQAVCELGSVFIAVVAPESAGAQVPTPAGSPPGG